jgi:hypothetical protein
LRRIFSRYSVVSVAVVSIDGNGWRRRAHAKPSAGAAGDVPRASFRYSKYAEASHDASSVVGAALSSRPAVFAKVAL